jgi:hypothetical protein
MPQSGLSLTSPTLGFMRQDLKVEIVGVRPPGQSDWLTGGENFRTGTSGRIDPPGGRTT